MNMDTLMTRLAADNERMAVPDGVVVKCRAHADSKPSLVLIHHENGKVGVTCRAGCTARAVVEASGLSMADLFNVSPGEGGYTAAAEKPAPVGVAQVAALRVWLDGLADLDATSAAEKYAERRFGLSVDQFARLGLAGYGVRGGQPEFISDTFARYPRMVVPFADFRGVCRGAQGRDLSGRCPARWVSLENDGGTWSKYAYLQAGSGFDTVLVCEGPGDALTAVGAGYDAVAVRGAGLAKNAELLAELVTGLRGRDVVIAGDRDRSGRAFTEALSAALVTDGGTAVRVLEIPYEGWDLTDWREDDPASFVSALHRAVRSAAEVEHQRNSAGDMESWTGAVAVDSGAGQEAARMLDKLIDQYGDSDAMNAHALVAWTSGRIKFAPGLGFYVWTGRVWKQSRVKVRQEIHRMGAALMVAGKPDKAKPFTMTTRIDNLLTELESVPNVHVSADEFDARPDLLSFENGTVDLRTGQLREHRKEDMLTVCLPVRYDPLAKAPRWEAFLREIFPAFPELVPYMQRMCGYGITGHTSEQCFMVAWGKGANGKSVLLDTLTEVFGQITKTTPFATFEEKGSGGIPNDIAALRGARLVMASEGEAGKAMSEAVLKRVTGKDKITARFLRQEFFTFAPTFLIMLATNHRPNFRGQDEGLWRRVKMVPFQRYFAPHERDYGLADRLLAEADGIVAWTVRGAVEWFRGGLQDPECVKDATANYRETSDQLWGFFPGVLERGSDGDTVPGTDAFNHYRDWCEAENLPAKEQWTRKAFYAAMEERGVPRKRAKAGMVLVGVRVAGPSPDGPGIFGGD
ncbi:phage/plasmid primase, P4 family [Streptomyces sp. NPDC001941]|uniref:phage/plasmid primase, P4 family n=1 Tax=Streptomyces sp. NPDC001941 TaxID=3154659 RepID=UPI00332835A6